MENLKQYCYTIYVYMFYKKWCSWKCPTFHKKILVPESTERFTNDYFFIYKNWSSYAPIHWKIDTLKDLVKRSSIFICSDQHLSQKEVDYLKKVFVK